MATQFVERP